MDDPDLGFAYGLMWGLVLPDSPLGIGPAAIHGGLAVQYLVIIPQDRLVLVHLVDTDQPWSLTNDDVGELIRLVLVARQSR